jgi:ankyrin repeat protein
LAQPIEGLLNYFHRANQPFYRLCDVTMNANLVTFQQEWSSKGNFIDPLTQVSILHIAASQAEKEVLEFLIQINIPIDSKDFMGNTPLHFAALSGNRLAVEFLLEHGANKYEENLLEQLPWQVVKKGELLPILLDPDTKTKFSSIPLKSLQEAVNDQDLEAAKYLLEMGFHPEMLNYKGYQVDLRLPLHDAMESRNFDMVNLLVEHGADLAYPRTNPYVYLNIAVKQSEPELVRLLLENGADPNQNLGFFSLLHHATRNNQIDIMKLLLDAGANPETQVAGYDFYYPPLREAQSKEAVDLLLQYGAKNDPEQMGEFSFFTWPVHQGLADVVKKFIEIGVPVDSANLWDMAISGRNSYQICNLFLDAGLDVNLSLSYDRSVIFKAIAYNKVDLIPLFIHYGADLDERNDNGNTPYEFALIRGNKRAIKTIEDYFVKNKKKIPFYYSLPTKEEIMRANKGSSSECIQLNWSYSAGVYDSDKWISAMKKELEYPLNALPRQMYITSEEDINEEEFDEESYTPPLMAYDVLFDPHDSRYFILIATYYDDFQYAYSYDFYIRFHPHDKNKAKKILQYFSYKESTEKQINLYEDKEKRAETDFLIMEVLALLSKYEA